MKKEVVTGHNKLFLVSFAKVLKVEDLFLSELCMIRLYFLLHIDFIWQERLPEQIDRPTLDELHNEKFLTHNNTREQTASRLNTTVKEADRRGHKYSDDKSSRVIIGPITCEPRQIYYPNKHIPSSGLLRGRPSFLRPYLTLSPTNGPIRAVK